MIEKRIQGNFPKLSIISACHDQLPYNRVFCEMLNRYTYYPFELIVVDNASSDGSGDFFRSAGATVLTQTRNCNYSEAMNIGTEKAVGEFICHMNNDVIVGVDWDRNLIEALNGYSLDFVSPASNEFMPTYAETRKSYRKWKRISKKQSGSDREAILGTWEKMYEDWENYCNAFSKYHNGKIVDGINGHTVVMKRSAWEKLGGYDERMLATDWDLYLRAKKREVSEKDLLAPKVIMWAYVHHFMGTTSRITQGKYDGKEGRKTFLNISDKWPLKELEAYWPIPMNTHPAPQFFLNPFRYLKVSFKKLFNLYQWGDAW